MSRPNRTVIKKFLDAKAELSRAEKVVEKALLKAQHAASAVYDYYDRGTRVLYESKVINFNHPNFGRAGGFCDVNPAYLEAIVIDDVKIL